MEKFQSKSEKETFNFAFYLSKKIKPGDIFLIEGELGAGKSIFVRGMSKGLGINEPMPSPSFTIVNSYEGIYPINHFDFYRINDPFELFEIGFEEYIYSDCISFIEWPSKAEELIPEKAIEVQISILDDNSREIIILWDR